MVRGPVNSQTMLEKGKNVDSTKHPGFVVDFEQLSQRISFISLEEKQEQQNTHSVSRRSSLTNSEFSERSSVSSVKWVPCQIMEEIYSELNNTEVGSSVIERGNRAKLRRSNSTIPRNRRQGRTVSDPVRSVIPKVCGSSVVRSFSLTRQPTNIGQSESFWEDGCKNTDLCSTEL